MKYLIIYILKGKHEKRLDYYQSSKYWADKITQEYLWDNVLKCRNKIRRLEPDYLIGYD